jgi:hypothetical protein
MPLAAGPTPPSESAAASSAIVVPPAGAVAARLSGAGSSLPPAWREEVFNQCRRLSLATSPWSKLLDHLTACATSTFAAARELARAQFPQLYAFCGGVACVMATTSSVESDFSRLRFAKTDYRNKLTGPAMERSMQASDPIAIARKMVVPIDFPGW